MKIAIRLPIGVKMSAVCVAVVLGGMVPTAFMVSAAFKKRAQDREEDANRAQADARASEVSVTLERTAEKIRLFAPLLLRHGGTAEGGKGSEQLLAESLRTDPDIVSIDIYETAGGKRKRLQRQVNEAYFKGYGLDDQYLKVVDKERPPPLTEAFAGEVAIRNRSLVKGAPLLTLALPIAKDTGGRVSHAAVANIRLDAVQKAFTKAGERTLFLVDSRGDVFAHPDESLAIGRVNLKKIAVVDEAIRAKMAQGALRYFKDEDRQFYFSSFAKAAFGMIVISEAPEWLILEHATAVERQVYWYTGVAISCAIFVVFLLSLTITRPIEKLVHITREIAIGNFAIPVASTVRTNDEVGTLAVSFDSMLAGLRERDKVKTILRKFHGSSVSESLLASETLQMGGTRKRVVVFFSDIRGFTAVSERSSPEQVVAMLNEYFTIMVQIILRHHGIVDKFIGDAIMAIWGAPKSTGQDARHAVAACIEMRQALQALNEKRIARGEDPLHIGMGVHVGEAISGNIGSDERMEYTVIGGAVNVASRIEAATKAFGVDVLVSEEIQREVQSAFLLDAAGAARVKGKDDALTLFKVRGYLGADGEAIEVRTPYSDFAAEDAEKVELVS